MPHDHIIVDTDNYGGDYPDERQLCWVDSKGIAHPLVLPKANAAALAQALRPEIGDERRYYKAVPQDYVLQPGFEP